MGRKVFRRVATVAAAAAVTFIPVQASATIHPIVESADCASDTADSMHPLGDVADPPGQTPNYGSHSTTSTLRAVQVANTSAFGKFNGECGG